MPVGTAQASCDTKPELAVRRLLHSMGLRYRVGYKPVHGIRRWGDIVFTRQKVAVFIDGCYWHGCPSHFVMPKTNTSFWSAKIEHNRKRDAETATILAPHGWRVMRFWEHEDPDDVARAIADMVRR